MLTKRNLQAELRQAIRAKNQARKRVLRMVLSAIKFHEVDRLQEIDPAELLSIIQKEVKTRRETLEHAERAGRQDMISALKEEIAILQAYLPQPLSEEELKKLAKATIAEVGATTVGETGRVMKALMPKVAGRAEGRLVSRLVQKLLAES